MDSYVTINLRNIFEVKEPVFNEFGYFDMNAFTGYPRVCMEEIKDDEYTNIIFYDDMTIIHPSNSDIYDIESDRATALDVTEDIACENLYTVVEVTEEEFDNREFTSTEIIEMSKNSVLPIAKNDKVSLIQIYGRNDEFYYKIRVQSPTRTKDLTEKVKLINELVIKPYFKTRFKLCPSPAQKYYSETRFKLCPSPAHPVECFVYVPFNIIGIGTIRVMDLEEK